MVPASSHRQDRIRDRTSAAYKLEEDTEQLQFCRARLEVRMARQTESATQLAKRLRGHPAVQIVRYPGFGGLLSFDVADAATARRVETATRMIVNMTSLGGVTSRIEARLRWEGNFSECITTWRTRCRP